MGHPPTLQRLWHLPADLVRTPLEELRSRHEVKLLSLPELLRLLKRRQRALDQVPGALSFGLWALGLGAWGARARACVCADLSRVRVCVCRSLYRSPSPLSLSLPLSLSVQVSLSLPLSLSVQVSLELKHPEHPEWPLQLSRLYALLKATGIAHKFALVAEDGGQARQHLEAQRQHGVRVGLLQLHRDVDAPRGADGVPHFNRRRVAPIARMQHAHAARACSTCICTCARWRLPTALAPPHAHRRALLRSAAAAARSLFGGWSVSVKLLEPSLMAAAAEARQEVCVWVVDEDAELERAWRLGVHGLVTNRPKWAQSQVQSWYEEACARESKGFL